MPYAPFKTARPRTPGPLTVKDYDGGPAMHISEFLDKQKELFADKDPNQLTFMDKGVPSDIWVTGTGLKLQTHQMSNRHLFNAIRYLARKDKRSNTLEAEMHKRLRQHSKISDANSVYVAQIPEQPSRRILRLKPCHNYQDGHAN
jgi:hypothetical protein